jgi:uroporphyrinogen-III synthase
VTKQDFQGLRVLTLESRRAVEISRLIETYGGVVVSAPAMREIPLEHNTEALQFAEELRAGKFDSVIFTTGVGARALLDTVATTGSTEPFLEALRRVKVVARGPKPMNVLREWDVPVAVAVPEPNTWRELLRAIDQSGGELRGKRVAVQEYGVPNPELLSGLEARGANVTRVPVYQWALPEDTKPLREAIEKLVKRQIDVALFTTGVQVAHLLEMARAMEWEKALVGAFDGVVVASIGPSTSETLRQQGIAVDFETSHPKMGFLVKEAAERSGELLRAKRSSGSGSRTAVS